MQIYYFSIWLTLFLVVHALPMEFLCRRPRSTISNSDTENIQLEPYIVSIVDFEHRPDIQCSALIISKNLILTAARCITYRNYNRLMIRAGSHFLIKGGSLHIILSFYRHENFRDLGGFTSGKNTPTVNDIAIAQVEPSFQFGATCQPISLFDADEVIEQGSSGVASGWGKAPRYQHQPNETANYKRLQTAVVPLYEASFCQKGHTLWPGLICAGGGSKDFCTGDSGGPLVVDGKLVGIASYSYDVGNDRGLAECTPTVYTDVAYFRNWIDEQVKKYDLHLPKKDEPEFHRENESRQIEEDCGIDFNYRSSPDGNASDFDENMWLAHLVYNTPNEEKVYGCGGVLLSKRYVLTAAHCVTELRDNWSLEQVRLGEYILETEPDCTNIDEIDISSPTNKFTIDPETDSLCLPQTQTYFVEKIIPHKEYDPSVSRGYDIALIRLNQTIPKFSDYIRPICLPTREPIRQKFVVGGWGIEWMPNNKKMRTYLSSVDTRLCRELYARQNVTMADDQICAGKSTITSTESACIADSGGPLMGIQYQDMPGIRRRWTVFGLITTDTNLCGVFGNPGIFVDVYRYRDWILQHVLE